jgi:hypothetical protein
MIKDSHMANAEPVPVTTQLAAITVCRDAFHWRDDVRAIFMSAGVPRALYDKYNDLGVSKAKIARYILDDLQAAGEAGATTQRKVINELCRMNKPHPDAPDQKAGMVALTNLRDEAGKAHLWVSPERAASDTRRAANDRRAQAVKDRRAVLGSLRDTYVKLTRLNPSSDAERQRRGYDFERLLADLFRVHDIEYRPSYRVQGEQIDGAFHFRGFTYLVETRWRADVPDFGHLVKFKAKVDGKFDSTRGFFISMAGFDQAVVDHAVRVARGTKNNIILFDGRDISLLFEGSIGLVDALTAKVDAAEQEGSMWRRL